MGIFFSTNAKKVPSLSVGLLGSTALLAAALVVVVLSGSSPFWAEGIKEKTTAMTSTTVQIDRIRLSIFINDSLPANLFIV